MAGKSKARDESRGLFARRKLDEMNIPRFLLLGSVLGAVFALNARAQNAKPLLSAHLARRAEAPVLFAPRGWKIEKQISGDLNRDKKPDAALVLVENTPAKDVDGAPTARRRALVVALREGKGWHRVGFNNSLLLGTRDGGAFYGMMETPVNVSIQSGVLVVNQENGSREVTETTHKFRLDKAAQRFYLIGAEKIDRDRASGNVQTISTNYLTGFQKTVAIQSENERQTAKTTRVSRKLRSLESVRVEERYSD